ncbi:HD domain-containing protein [Desulfovibrio litoralis]|uniref:5'-deoxynucleotidase n=1 Tax=Desulfovibrio litoralis DSM 11393 TaxID=1121455 RepID=A0A1M7S9B8_9BACT|nr:HD domain-containing protein [Desulfovibrio litoralis]SHN54892.1 putative hydrolases of HD superfamily [Desulfovibrio litoralis DSM 11393]
MTKNNNDLVDFLFEAGMLRHTPRSGYAFLGSGKESVADHSFRVAIIGQSMALKLNANPLHTMQLCLYHDFHEARTGDLNYVNKLYAKIDADAAFKDAVKDQDLAKHLLPLWQELVENKTLEAQITHDADQLDLLLNLKREKDLGNTYAEAWAKCCIERLKLEYSIELAKDIMQRDHSAWWFEGQDMSWWERKGQRE